MSGTRRIAISLALMIAAVGWTAHLNKPLHGAVKKGSAFPADSIPAIVQESQTILVSYLSTGYKYKVVPQGADSGFQQPGFDDSAFSVGDAGFGTPSGHCPINNPMDVRTTWPLGTDILLRKTFQLPSGATNLRVGVAIDNDVQVFINGQDISGGFRNHENCASLDTFVFSAPNSILIAGVNLLSVRGRDRGILSYLDVKVTADISGLQFYPLPAPVRLLDTRLGASPDACSQPNQAIAGGTSRTQAARNFCGIPATAEAITGNVTTVQSEGGYLTLYPSDVQRPTVASTNYGPNEVVNNVFTVGLGNADGAFNIYPLNTSEVVVDVTGYYAPPGAGGLYFHPLPAPVRLLETRPGEPVGCVRPGVPLIADTDSSQTAATACTGIPATARAIAGNATTVSPQGPGYLTIFPCGAERPVIASSNYDAGQVINGPFVTGVSPAGQFKIYTFATTHLVVDVLGYFSAEAVDANGAGLLFTPLAHPVRLLETRNNPNFPGCFKPNQPLNGNQVYAQAALGLCDGLTIPSNALGVVGNATVVFPVTDGYLTLWPSNAPMQPTTATSNYNAGQIVNRHFIVGLGNADGAFKIFSLATTDLVIDLSGYFAP
jgi:hypothetical protein